MKRFSAGLQIIMMNLLCEKLNLRFVNGLLLAKNAKKREDHDSSPG